MRIFSTIFFCLFLIGCADLKKPPLEIELPSQDWDLLETSENHSKVIIFNSSNKLLYGPDGTGKINISLNEKSIGQLNIGEYLVLELAQGSHTINLLHKDIVLFRSEHEVIITDESKFIKIYAKLTSNGLELVEEPKDFKEKYRNAFQKDT